MPTNLSASRALARDLRIARAQTKVIRAAFRSELADVVRVVEAGGDPAAGVTDQRWIDTLGRVWLETAYQVYDDTVEQFSGPAKAGDTRELLALIQNVIRRGRPAEQITRFIEERAEGISTFTRKRIHTILAEAGTPSDLRGVVRAISRLYRTEFVADRSSRIAVDNVLRASMTFTDAAVQQVSASTGRQYVKRWVTQGDAKVRNSHRDAALVNTAVAMDDFFKVGGTLLRFPRDPAGPASETRNCRCWVEYRPAPTPAKVRVS